MLGSVAIKIPEQLFRDAEKLILRFNVATVPVPDGSDFGFSFAFAISRSYCISFTTALVAFDNSKNVFIVSHRTLNQFALIAAYRAGI